MATTYERERKLTQEIAPRVEHAVAGVDVLAVELVSRDRFCVFIDHPQGVDHALCARVTDVLRDYLREYEVDVSSPGIERPLRKQEHFAQVVGRKVSLRTETRKRLRGTVLAADEDVLALGVDSGERHDIPYESIVRGNLIDERV
jgi:ribosome maturation factor RimP